MAGAFGTGLKYSVFGYLSEDKDLDLSDGLCANSDDPDLWFAGEVETVEGEVWRNTKDQRRRYNLEVEKAASAVSVCKNCPVKKDCLELGMRGTQIHYGIYGGTMPGERLTALGHSPKKGEVANKIVFARKVRALIKERGL